MNVSKFGRLVLIIGCLILGYSVLQTILTAPSESPANWQYISCLYDLSNKVIITNNGTGFKLCHSTAGILTYLGAAIAVVGFVFMASAKKEK